MKLVLLGICLLCVVVVTEGKKHGGSEDHHEKPPPSDYDHYYDGWKDWHTCSYEDDGHVETMKCRECCGEEGDQYCCDDYDYDSDEDDHYGRHGPHKAIIVVIIGCLAAVIFIVVSISCCIFYTKYKKHQSSRMHPGNFSGVVSTVPAMQPTAFTNSIPSMQPEDKKSALPNADIYTGQNKDNHDINAMLTAPPPYSAKY